MQNNLCEILKIKQISEYLKKPKLTDIENKLVVNSGEERR